MDNFSKMNRFLQIIGDANRLRIICQIGEGELSVSEIVEAVGLSQPLVSHHLRSLKNNGILGTNRKGPFVYYRLKNIQLLEGLLNLSRLIPDIELDNNGMGMMGCFDWHKKMGRINRKKNK